MASMIDIGEWVSLTACTPEAGGLEKLVELGH